MDEDRKYRQRGYMDDRGFNERKHPDRDRPPRPRLPIDVTGPRLPRMVQAVTASRCWNCAVTLPAGTDMKGQCPKCSAPLHCCKQCAHFEPSTRFQCRKPIPERIAYKDKPNECTWFSPRVTVAREASGANAAPPIPLENGSRTIRDAKDARAAFDSLFKKLP